MERSSEVIEVSEPRGTATLSVVGLSLALVAPVLGLVVSIVALVRAKTRGSADAVAPAGVVVSAGAIVFAVACLWALSSMGLIGFSFSMCVQGVDGCPVLPS
ncbi:hypothetical protein GCM10010988_01460 [Cnuibacter physcomitrellae]|uniref:Uncharacterized protein n=1 Tax=Cnuibacter physcomitrellae TaxID=1619308 RepID=A0A1X9LLC8_9MICO|nr:hypothetical protein [Cnuibacter physcomitrellae]ARJ05098.1 hypothetical protein B5808_07680 [Cnuibacter physcomitrellae]GGI34945.1 hypothetical protein GCM10010988_01460 [Cnuibacter physcomitrellae]